MVHAARRQCEHSQVQCWASLFVSRTARGTVSRPEDASVSCSYWLDPYSLFFVEVILMQFAEIKRWQDYRKPGSQGEQYFLGLEQVLKGSGDPSYPGLL